MAASRDIEIRVDGNPISLRAWRRMVREEQGRIPDGYITGAEATRILGVKPGTLRGLREQGEVGHRKVKNVWYYSSSDLAALLLDT